MTNRMIFVTWYVLTPLALLAVLKFAIIPRSAPLLFILFIIIFWVVRFLINFWYAKKLQTGMAAAVLSSIFHNVGFIYLMGYDTSLIGVGAIVDKSIKLYKENFKLFGSYLLLSAVVVVILGAGLALAGGFIGSKQSSLITVALTVFLIIIAVLALFVIMFWFMASLMRVIAARYLGAPASKMTPELNAAKPIVVNAIIVSFLSGLIVVGGFILLIIPGILFSLWYYFSLYATVIDNQKPIEALGESRKLIKGRWWAVAWRLIAPSFILGIISWSLQLLVSAPAVFLQDNKSYGAIVAGGVSGILSIAISVIFIPLTTAISVILYLELKKTPLNKPQEITPAQTQTI